MPKQGIEIQVDGDFERGCRPCAKSLFIGVSADPEIVPTDVMEKTERCQLMVYCKGPKRSLFKRPVCRLGRASIKYYDDEGEMLCFLKDIKVEKGLQEDV